VVEARKLVDTHARFERDCVAEHEMRPSRSRTDLVRHDDLLPVQPAAVVVVDQIARTMEHSEPVLDREKCVP
jgi:hypothetical protein